MNSAPHDDGDISARLTARIVEDPRLVVTISEAAAFLGISRSFAYELVRRGELRVIRLGRRQVVPKLSLLELAGLATATVTAVPEVTE